MRFRDVDLPEPVKDLITNLGFTEAYPPQEAAINSGVLEGRNLVLASPTASGKTLIALMVAAQHIYEKRGKVVYLVPLRALASEKYNEFKSLENLTKNNGGKVRIRLSTGDYDTPGGELKRADLIIATNEKMDSLIRHSPHWLRDVSLIVVDEIHIIHTPDRGPTLEVLVTRLLRDLPKLQFLALSATISNSEEFSKWLKAEVITTEWRPVPLKEGVFHEEAVHFNDGDSIEIPSEVGKPQIDIALRTIDTSGQAIIFTKTRREAVGTARKVADVLQKRSSSQSKGLLDQAALSEVANRILQRGERTRLTEELAGMVRKGTAFHHAGLPSIHRKIVEDAFRNRLIKILTATPTLAAGVNLPSRTVIITYYERYSMGYSELISVFEYKQMSGRAGRPQYDEYGESVLIAKNEDYFKLLFNLYVKGEPERLTSKLGEEEALEMHLLGLIASKGIQSSANIMDFVSQTLYSLQQTPRKIMRKVKSSLKSLEKGGLIEMKKGFYKPTPFGYRVAQLYISPSTGVTLREYIEPIEDASLHPLGSLHLVCSTRDMSLFPLYRRETEDMKSLLEESEDLMIVKPPSKLMLFSYTYEDYLQQLKTALTLHDWTDELSEESILKKWRVQPGDLHTVAYTAEWLLYSASQLAYLFKKKMIADDLRILSRRVRYGIREELSELVLLEGVGRVRARNLFKAGYKEVKDLARASTTDLEKVPAIGSFLARSIVEQASKKSYRKRFSTS